MPAPLSFADARACVLARVRDSLAAPQLETVALAACVGRVLGCNIAADRDYPPFHRAMRDGYAVRSDATPGSFEIVGEVRAGARFEGSVGVGQAVEIMTGAAVPEGADAVVMVEHARVESARVEVRERLAPGTHISPRGCEAGQGSEVLRAGARISAAEMALLASVGAAEVLVYARPKVAILTTGDELVAVNATLGPQQIRDSSAWSLAVQVARAGGEPVVLPTAPDSLERTISLVEVGLRMDLLLVSGGVSAGRYDYVEQALASHGAEFCFDRVLIQPGQPLVFGRARGTFFFGLPGNPVSTMVCFEVFARAALELIAGVREPQLPITEAPLAVAFHHKPGLTRFLPAWLDDQGKIAPVRTAGSADLGAICRANAFLVAAADKAEYAAGERIGVLLRSS